MMDYINELRQYIGHRPIFLVGATVLIFDSTGKLLMLQRSDNHCWGLPGGSLEPGEELENTAIRETREETGLEISDLCLWDVFSGPQLFYEYPNQDQVHNVSIVYKAIRIKGEPKINLKEHIDFGYFPLGKLPEPLSPPIIPIMHKLLQNPKKTLG